MGAFLLGTFLGLQFPSGACSFQSCIPEYLGLGCFPFGFQSLDNSIIMSAGQDRFSCAYFCQSVQLLTSDEIIIHSDTGTRWQQKGIHPVLVFPAMFDMHNFSEGLFLEKKFIFVILPEISPLV
ncbi:hypothetical protein CFR75_16875 [Komagataeibacter xylinus]|uniref:Uncharacterized protein n=1 Tax=Komagataeibacter xylinus TaxID=28448 RepID=A0A318PK62_KOMXY|nr:hypothetical protein CFR75_16875 [Komagataeibacter xylinus]